MDVRCVKVTLRSDVPDSWTVHDPLDIPIPGPWMKLLNLVKEQDLVKDAIWWGEPFLVEDDSEWYIASDVLVDNGDRLAVLLIGMGTEVPHE